MAVDLEKAIRAIQREADRKWGHVLSCKFWYEVEDQIGTDPLDLDGDPDGQESYLESYSHMAELCVRVLQSVPPIKAKPSTGNEKLTEPKDTYRQPFERRIHLVSFIWDKKGGISARANWKQLTTEWNKEHPYDQRNPVGLRVEYHRILKDDDVTQSIIALKLLPFVKYMLDAAEALGKGFDKEFDKIMDFCRQHPEAKNLNELIELEEAYHERPHRKAVQE